MKAFEPIDVVKKLIGPVTPTGSHNTDLERFENLKELCELTEGLLTIIINDVAYDNKHCHEESIKNMVEFAEKWITDQGIEE